jgi:4-aminobutyrate aminotransferase-like enzyme
LKHTSAILKTLCDFESRNVTFIDPGGGWPIVWERAKGAHVWDAEGRKYLDLTAAFGVANAGHANSAVVRAGQRQMRCLLHAMGDVHPHALKARLARELSRLTFGRWHRAKSKAQCSTLTDGGPATGKVIFCNSGFEAVEAGLKTAALATGRPGVIAFEGAYHGLGYGALATTHREHFRRPFHAQLATFGSFVSFPREASDLPVIRSAIEGIMAHQAIGAILVEPIQGRGGIRVPPAGFLPMLRELADAHDALLIADEIFTGFGRTGKWFACEHEAVVPDVICLGKALTGGFPLSACVGRADVMDTAWPESSGEAIHTSTFLGHPVGCAMALAQIGEIRTRELVGRSERLGAVLLASLARLKVPSSKLKVAVRGRGLMAGVELHRADGSPAGKEVLAAIKAMLRRGFILLPEGEHGNVIAFTPPLSITEPALKRTVAVLGQVLDEAS